MALRVLLADNSEAIRKVIQLSLQDFAAEVRTVSMGIDVLAVARQFKPDLVFADILLQKRSGYEVCADIKADPELLAVPVVLMWSGFMELDRTKMQECRADGALEKPFESSELRDLVKRLVPKLATNPMSEFLNVPAFAKKDVPVAPPTPPPPPTVKTPEPPLPPQAAAPVAPPSPPQAAPTAKVTPPPLAPPAQESAQDWSMDSFEDINEFQVQETAKTLPDLEAPENLGDQEEEFAQKPLNQVSKEMAPNSFELDVPDEADFDGVTVEFKVPDDVTDTDFLKAPATPARASTPQVTAAPEPKVAVVSASPPPPTDTQTAVTAPAALTEAQMEELLTHQSREIIEKIVWKLVPDMAERIIRDEIKRLLDEPDLKV